MRTAKYYTIINVPIGKRIIDVSLIGLNLGNDIHFKKAIELLNSRAILGTKRQW